MKKLNKEKAVRNILIVLVALSFIISSLNWTYLTYQNLNIEIINDLLVNVNSWLLPLDNLLVYVFAIFYIILGIKSKKEVALKIAFSIFSILSTTIVMVLIVNFIAEIFKIF